MAFLRRNPELIQHHEDAVIATRVRRCCGQALAEPLGEEVRTIAGHEPLVRCSERVGEADEHEPRAAQTAAVHAAHAVRRGD